MADWNGCIDFRAAEFVRRAHAPEMTRLNLFQHVPSVGTNRGAMPVIARVVVGEKAHRIHDCALASENLIRFRLGPIDLQ